MLGVVLRLLISGTFTHFTIWGLLLTSSTRSSSATSSCSLSVCWTDSECSLRHAHMALAALGRFTTCEARFKGFDSGIMSLQ